MTTEQRIAEALADLVIFRSVNLRITEGKWADRYRFLLKSLDREVQRLLAMVPIADKVSDVLASDIWHKIGEHSMALHQLHDRLESLAQGNNA